MARVFGRDDSHFREVELADDLYTISIDPQHAIEEYLRLQLPVRALADLLSGSRMFQYFAAATPGHERAGDDREDVGAGPARAAHPRRGPLRPRDRGRAGHRARRRHDARAQDVRRHRARRADRQPGPRDPRDDHRPRDAPGSSPSRCPRRCRSTRRCRCATRCAASSGSSWTAWSSTALYEQRFSARDASALRRAADTAGTPTARAAVRAALSAHLRARGQREQVARLEEGTGDAPVLLPFLFQADLDLAGLRAALRAAGGASCERRRGARGQARVHLRRLRRRRQDHDRRGDRDGRGRARARRSRW